MSNQRIPISQLTETQTAPDASYIAIDDGSLTKKITVENFNSTSTASAQQYATQAAASAQTVEDNIATSAAQIREATLAAREATQASTAATASATSAYDSASLAQNYSVNAATSAGQAMNAADTVAQGVTESKEYAEDSEAWAVGQRDGVDVPSTDETYHNNAKYYAQAAEDAIAGIAVTPEMFGAIENGVCNIEKFQTMLNSAKYVRFTSDFEFQFIPNSTVASPTRIKIENKKGLVIDGGGHTVTMSGLTKEYLESINDISSSGRDIFSFLAFHGCENITVKDINFVGTNAADANNAFRFASPRSIGVAFKGCNNCFVENVNGINILGNVVNTSTADDLSTGCNKIIIANCKAQNCYENGFNIMGASVNCIIDGCVSIRCGTGIEAFGDTCIIQNCLVSQARSVGIAVSGGATAKNNKVIGSIGEGAGIGIGIAVTGASTLISKNCKILNNHVKDCKGFGIYVYPYTENTEVKGNVFENNNIINTYTVANSITGTSSNKTKDLIIDGNIFKSTTDDQKCFMASNVNGVAFINNIVDHVLPTAVYSINFDGTCENFKACGNTLTKRVNKSGEPTNYFIGNNVVGKTIPEIVSD